MHSKNQFRNLLFRAISCAVTAATAMAFMLIVVAPQPAQAQTFSVLYSFKGGTDGANPYAGLVRDAQGNLYGTAILGGDLTCSPGPEGPNGCGTVFKLTYAVLPCAVCSIK